MPAILPVMSIPPRGPSSWPNTVTASANPIYHQIVAITPNNDDSLIQTTQKMIKSDPLQTENTPVKTTIPHPVSLIPENYAAASGPATANIVATPKCQEEKWGPCCQYCAQSTSHPGQNWSEEDWDGEKAKQKEMQIKEEKLKQELAAEEQGASKAYYAPSPQYKPVYEEDPPIISDLPSELIQGRHSDCNKIRKRRDKY